MGSEQTMKVCVYTVEVSLVRHFSDELFYIFGCKPFIKLILSFLRISSLVEECNINKSLLCTMLEIEIVDFDDV